ncbi:MAG TPA: hypothetical protein EYO71_02795 [Rhodospirillales bacterium]|nr:hypothetical protein [Rhodospirillales bacterium]
MSDYNHAVKARMVLNEFGEDGLLEEISEMLELFEEAGLEEIAYDYREVLKELHKITGRPKPSDTIH